MTETDRSARLKAALRDNLKRRKAQARGRETDKNIADSPDGVGDSSEKRERSPLEPAPSDRPPGREKE